MRQLIILALGVSGLCASCAEENTEITVANAADKFCECKALQPESGDFSEEFKECNKQFYEQFSELINDAQASTEISELTKQNCN